MKNVGNQLLLAASNVVDGEISQHFFRLCLIMLWRRLKAKPQGCFEKLMIAFNTRSFLTSCLSRVIFKFDYWLRKRLEKREKSHLSRRRIPEFHSSFRRGFLCLETCRLHLRRSAVVYFDYLSVMSRVVSRVKHENKQKRASRLIITSKILLSLYHSQSLALHFSLDTVKMHDNFSKPRLTSNKK
jgi:hypothetical protein